jgi:NhaP-type Na+/H+ and K+/H+ antiporter
VIESLELFLLAASGLLISWVGLRGAVPIFLAIIPVVSPGPVDVTFFNVVFMVVIASLVPQGWTIPWLARRLDLEDKREVPPSESLERRQ